MKIGLDLDDVLVDFIWNLRIFNNIVHGTELEMQDFTSYYLGKVIGIPKEEDAIARIEEYHRSKYFETLLPISGAIDRVAELKKAGHELHIITARHPKLKELTEAHVNGYFKDKIAGVHYARNHYCYDGDRKEKWEICRDLGIRVMVEDSIDYAEQCSKVTRVILLNKPWNQCSKETEAKHNILRVPSWMPIPGEIERLAA